MMENLAWIMRVSMLVAPRIFWLLFLTMNTHSSLQHWGEVCGDLSLLRFYTARTASAGKDLFSTLCTRQWIHVRREMFFVCFFCSTPVYMSERKRDIYMSTLVLCYQLSEGKVTFTFYGQIKQQREMKILQMLLLICCRKYLHACKTRKDLWICALPD